MLLYLLPRRELREPDGAARVPADRPTIRRTVEYYLARTCHGSSLSAVVHAWGLATLDPDRALGFLEQALHSDSGDPARTGTTAEGIHLAAMAGSADLIQRCFTGLTTANDVLRFGPRWPAKLGTLRMMLRYRGHQVAAKISTASVTLTVDPGPGPAIAVRCYGRTRLLRPGDSHTWTAARPGPGLTGAVRAEQRAIRADSPLPSRTFRTWMDTPCSRQKDQQHAPSGLWSRCAEVRPPMLVAK